MYTPAAWWAGTLDVALGYRMTGKDHDAALSKTPSLRPVVVGVAVIPRKVADLSSLVVQFHSRPYRAESGGRVFHVMRSSMNLLV